jgi:hypothetical protein
MYIAVAAAYADDTSAAVAAKTPSTVIETCVALVNELTKWVRNNGITVSEKTRIVTNFAWPPTRELRCATRNIALDVLDASSESNSCTVIGLTIRGKPRGKISFDDHVAAAVTGYWSDVALLMVIRNWTSTAVVRQMYNAICLPHLARHLPAIATDRTALATLARTHSQGLKMVFGLLRNTRNVTAVHELGFPTMEELAETRATAIATRLQYFPSLAIAKDARALAVSLFPTHVTPATTSPGHAPPLADGGAHLVSTPHVIFVHPTTTHDSVEDKIAYNAGTLAAIPDHHYVVFSDGSRCPPQQEAATGAGAAAILLSPADPNKKHMTIARWQAGCAPAASMLTCEGVALTTGGSAVLADIPPTADTTIITDSLSFVLSVSRGLTNARSLLDADFYTLAASRRPSEGHAALFVRFAFSHVTTPQNTPGLGDLIDALTTVDLLAKDAAQREQAVCYSRAEDRLRHLRATVRNSHRHAIVGQSLRGKSAAVHPGSFWRAPPKLPAHQMRMLLQARCGICSSIGGHLHGDAATCHLCHQSIEPGHDTMVTHVFTCPSAAAQRAALGATSIDDLWLVPDKAVKVLQLFNAQANATVPSVDDNDSSNPTD